MNTTKAPPTKPNGRARQSLPREQPYKGDASESALSHELAVLGCLVSYPEDATATFGADLEPALFSQPRRIILEAASEVLAAGVPLSIVTLTDQLRNRGDLEKIGGPAEITQLVTKHECGPTSAAYSLFQLREHAARRLGAETGTWLAGVTANGSFESGAVAEEMLRRTEEISRLAAGRRREHDLPDIEDAFDLLQEHIPTPPEVVAGLLHQGSKMVIGGGSKSYKTWMLTDLALSVSLGLPWMNFETCRGAVLYVNLEIQRGFFRKRIHDISASRGVRVPKERLHLWNLRGFAADLSDMLPKILRRLKSTSYSLIIIDPIYKVLGDRDENAAGDIATLLNMIERLAVESNAAVVFGAHFSKGNQAAKESIDRIGGSGVYARDPDSIMVLTRHEEEQAFTVESTLRNNPPIEPFVVRWEFPLMKPDSTLDPAKLKQVGGRTKEHDAAQLLAFLEQEELSMKEWEKVACEEGPMSSRTFYRLAKELKAAKKVTRGVVSGKWMKR